MTESGSKTAITAILIVLGVVAAAAIIYMVDVDQTQEAKLPEVKVEGGQAPKFDVKTGEVKVTGEKVKVKVPEVDVKVKETEVTVPKVEVTPPEETNKPNTNQN